MSWLAEIAEKAEDLLNKVDKTAATALQNKPKFGSSNDIRIKSNFPTKTYDNSFPNFNSKIASTTLSASNSPNTGNTLKNLNSRKNLNNDDEKLLQFLNSNEPLPQTSLIVKSPIKCQMESSYLTDLSSNETTNDTFDGNLMSSDSFVNFETSSSSELLHESLMSNENQNLPKSIPVVEQKDVEISIDHIIEEKLQMASNISKDNVSEVRHDIEQIQSGPVLMNENISSVNDSLVLEKLKQELVLANNKADYSDSEMKRMQKKLEHWNSQISGNDKLVRDLQDRERDFKAEIDAKNSQLAVLKVRFEEAEQEILNKRTILEELKIENERLKAEHSHEVTMLSQVRDALKIKLSEIETELSKSKETYRITQNEHLSQMSKLEDEQRQLVENVTKTQRKCSELNDRNKEFVSQVQNFNRNLENLQHEYAEYKLKAQRILQSKEKLIEELKTGNLDHESASSPSSYTILSSEAEGIKQERDLLREELLQANELAETLRNEIQAIEKLSQTDSEAAREHCRNIEEQLRQERSLAEEVQLQNNQLKEELQFLREDLRHTKSNLQSRIQDRDVEIDKLRRQLTAKSMSTVSQDELESRLHALTENLIQKQTMVEALSTEKNSLALQLERLELQLKEAQHFENQHTVVGLNNTIIERKQRSAAILDNPYDSASTRRIKKMYSTVDTFSIRLGVFFRRYPIARFFLIVYMLLLHLWVMIVLLTYEPEIHNTTHKTILSEPV